MRVMKRQRKADFRSIAGALVMGGLLMVAVTPGVAEEPSEAATAGYDAYVSKVEARLAREHQSRDGFLAAASSDPQSDARLRNGELIIERLTPDGGGSLPGALLHDWRGTAFVAGAKAADFGRLIKDINGYKQHFAPQVLASKVTMQQDDHLQATMRLRQQHIITVVMDSAYDVHYGQLDAQHGYSISHSTQMTEIDDAGTSKEHALNGREEHGYLWRLNTYWSYEERDGGLYMQIETVSLTRSIPMGFGWILGPFVESIPRDSLEFILRSAANALRK